MFTNKIQLHFCVLIKNNNMKNNLDNNFWNNIFQQNEKDEELYQDGNDKIAVFCGGVLEMNNIIGELYRFDEIGCNKGMMKCPPFGVIARCGSDGLRMMKYHCDYNWLMVAIKECHNKIISVELVDKFKEISNALTDFYSIYDNMHIIRLHAKVIEFIDIYNNLK